MQCTLFIVVVLLSARCLADQSTFDCKMRELAMEYAHKIQPWLSDLKFQEIADALNGAEEAQNCSVSFHRRVPLLPKPPSFPLPHAATYFVDANKGSDSNTGSMGDPFKTIPRALVASRISPSAATIILRGGVFYLTDTVMLDAKDSGLTIQNFPGEEVTVSGGKVIYPSWEPVNTVNSMNIYKADLSMQGVDSVTGFRVNGSRATRARYPNANPETQGFGSLLKAKKWLPPSIPPYPDVEENPDKPFRDSGSTFQRYQLGIGGSCANFDPPAGYWCGNNTFGGGAFTYRVPSGMVADSSILPHQPYQNAVGAVVQAWRPGHWSSWMFEVGGYESESGTFTFSKGGFQGARGKNAGEEFFIENIMEELDYLNEWFYDGSSKVLYFFYNASSGTVPPPYLTYVVPTLKTLISVKASQQDPARSITIRGITFRDTAYTYMDPHGMPSGGDWGLQRMGSLYFEGTENMLIQDCIFKRLDGNAIMVSGYNRMTTIYKNEFLWIGDTAIAQWGDTSGSAVKGMGWDGTSGNQPRYSQIIANFVHELGVYEKQSSFYFQAKSCQNTIKGNIFFNGPRAGINFNDGFGGGSTVTENLIFNTCRESGDHGPFNSWDRQVYVTKVKTGTASPIKEWDYITQNFMIANYQSIYAIDNDDGSAYYKTHDNVFVYGLNGGMKSDFGGHDNHHYNNIYVYVPAGFRICAQLKGHEDYFYNNAVVMTKDGDYGNPKCTGDGKTVVYNNKIYTPNGKVTECNMTLALWQALGNDPGTTATTTPQDSYLIMMIKEMWETH